MKVELELTKNQIIALRHRMGLKTKTKPEVVLNALVNLVVEDKHILRQW
jgi:hypothetical protein